MGEAGARHFADSGSHAVRPRARGGCRLAAMSDDGTQMLGAARFGETEAMLSIRGSMRSVSAAWSGSLMM